MMQDRKTGDVIWGWLGLSHTAGSMNWWQGCQLAQHQAGGRMHGGAGFSYFVRVEGCKGRRKGQIGAEQDQV